MLAHVHALVIDCLHTHTYMRAWLLVLGERSRQGRAMEMGSPRALARQQTFRGEW